MHLNILLFLNSFRLKMKIWYNLEVVLKVSDGLNGTGHELCRVGIITHPTQLTR